jgi:aminopeptidase N
MLDKQGLISFVFLFCGFLFGFQTIFAQSEKELQGGLREERTCFDVVFYDLKLNINPDKRYIVGSNKITFKVLKATQKIQLDLYDNLKIDSVVFKGKKLTFKRKHNAFFVNFNGLLPQNSVETVEVFYNGKPKSDLGTYQDKGFHWEKDRYKRHLVGVSCEGIGASVWFPNKDHLADEPDSVRLHWTFPAEFTCISNGVLEKEVLDSLKKEKTWTWFVSYPINNYNITFYMGHYKKLLLDFVSNDVARQISCYYYTDDKVAEKFFAAAPSMISFCEKMFGGYPYWKEKFAILQAPYRGMEHQTCINISEKLFLDDYAANELKLDYPDILIHEIAHEWWGNAVSVGDMADMWLHEGFATYVEILYLEHLHGKQWADRHVESLQQYTIKGNVLGERNIYDNVFRSYNIYGKGAKTIHRLRKRINNDVIFFDILKTFQSRYQHKIVYTEDFIKVVNEKTGEDYTTFLMAYLKED